MVAMEKPKSDNKVEKDCKLNCFDNEVVCQSAPCVLGKEKFGTHERIIDFYLSNRDWGPIYYYLVDLIHLFRLDCDYEKLEVLRHNNPDKEIPLKDYPLGCRVFKISEVLKELKDTLEYYEGLIEREGPENLSKQGKTLYNQAKLDFKKKVNANMKVLSHLVMKVEFDRFEKNSYFENGIRFLEKAIEAKEKYGIDIKVPNLLEETWKEQTKGAGYDPEKEKRREKNEKRLKEAKTKALMDKIQKKIMNNEKIDEELREKLKDLTGDD